MQNLFEGISTVCELIVLNMGLFQEKLKKNYIILLNGCKYASQSALGIIFKTLFLVVSAKEKNTFGVSEPQKSSFLPGHCVIILS